MRNASWLRQTPTPPQAGPRKRHRDGFPSPRLSDMPLGGKRRAVNRLPGFSDPVPGFSGSVFGPRQRGGGISEYDGDPLFSDFWLSGLKWGLLRAKCLSFSSERGHSGAESAHSVAASTHSVAEGAYSGPESAYSGPERLHFGFEKARSDPGSYGERSRKKPRPAGSTRSEVPERERAGFSGQGIHEVRSLLVSRSQCPAV